MFRFIFIHIFMSIDINKVDDDIMQEHVAPENEDAKQMLDRLSRDMLGMSAQELYLKWILLEIQYLQANAENANDREKLLKYLKAVDDIMWFSKDKRDVVVKTQLKSAADIFNSTSI